MKTKICNLVQGDFFMFEGIKYQKINPILEVEEYFCRSENEVRTFYGYTFVEPIGGDNSPEDRINILEERIIKLETAIEKLLNAK